MKVLVTGGAGFVGSYLVDHHVAKGDSVVVVDDLSTGDLRNLARHPPDRIRFIQARVEHLPDLGALLDDVERVYHLAAAVGVFAVLEHPLDALRRNLGASEVVFEEASRRGIRTIFTSTSEVYGKNDADALAENGDSVFGPTSVSRWLYAISKAADECLALAYQREAALPITAVRLFNTAGPRQTGAYGMVLPRLVRQSLAGEPLTVFGDGSQKRCFTNVHDVIQAITRLADTDAAIGRVVNVGQPHEIAIFDLAELVRRITGSRSPIQLVAYDEAYGPGFEDMRRRVPDVSLLRELTGYVPSTPLEETIRQMVAAVEAAA